MTPKEIATLRLTFITAALQGMASSEKLWIANAQLAEQEGVSVATIFARDALKLANAQIAELQNFQKPDGPAKLGDSVSTIPVVTSEVPAAA